MRACSKTSCSEPAEATIGLRYDERIVWMADLTPERDPNLLELCGSHADRLTPPRGWDRRDDRIPARPAATSGETDLVLAQAD